MKNKSLSLLQWRHSLFSCCIYNVLQRKNKWKGKNSITDIKRNKRDVFNKL